jgi:23S rRNA (cytosine1962-C5)-methyltransferase
MKMHKIIVKKGRDKSLRRRHPWLFSGAVERIEGRPEKGETVDVVSADGVFLGRGAYSSRSQIRVRIWTFDPVQEVSSAFFRARISAADQVRKSLGLLGPGAACRLVNGESDGLPGLIVDRYADHLVCQFLTAGVERWREEILDALVELLPSRSIYERSDVEVRGKEGLAPRKGLVRGEEPPERIAIEEGPCRFEVDVRRGHKTGFYLDQRENRATVLDFAAGAEVLNCFAYTGGFGIVAQKGGSSRVTHVESSPELLELARSNTLLNGLDTERVEYRDGNVFQVLRQYREEGRRFDLVILDPPRFIDSMQHLEPGGRGYKDINLLAFKILRPGGFLFTFSCSGLMVPDLFQKIVADAALDAGRDAKIIRRMGLSADHPTALSFPEGGYLKGFLIRVNDE